MRHKPFLRCIAETFLQQSGKANLKDYCFIFPNRRSGIFFEKELIDCADGAFVLPHITTISDFVCDITQMVECGRIELLLDLYNEYKKIIGSECEPFDEFSFWGDVILNDFNDIDLYLIESQQLFSNLKEYKEIGTDYLDSEQKEALKEYFGESAVHQSHNLERFWKHSSAYNNDNENPKQYFHLWELLGDLYLKFNERLSEKGVAYSGQIYRKAVDILKKQDLSQFQYKQYVFVGFNVLSKSEIKIFSILKERNIADFYWDFNSPALRDNNNKATTFLNKNINTFKSKYDIGETIIDTFPNISAFAIPGNVGQVKYATNIVENLINENKVDHAKNLLDTAIVLPDENLFIPLSGSIDKNKINKVNITMGFPLKKSLVSTLLSSISKIHRQSRQIKGIFHYYIEDVKGLIAHPYIKLIAPEETKKLSAKLAKDRLFFIPASTFQEYCPSIKELFSPITGLNKQELIRHTNTILDFLINRIITPINSKENGSIEITCIHKYIEQFHQLIDIINDYDIELSENTFFYLIDRFISGSIVSLQGEPLEGLQIMGILETRCLDFRNIIIPSMNEKVFPRKHFSRSFIPYNIRKGFGMSTVEYQESMYAYYFYRMISRAENVFLLYDARTSGLGSGDPSRYIQQLCRIYNDSKTTITHASFDISSIKELEINVPKTPRVMKKLNLYRTKDSGKYLSASSINSYIACPLKFYLEKVEGLYIEDEITQFMSYSTFGTIIHEIMHNIYSPYKGKLVTYEYINSFISNQNHCLDKEIVKTVNEIYYNKGANCYNELDGEGYMIQDVIKHYILEILKYDSLQEFTYIEGEEKGEEEEKDFWDVFGINFKQYIDRVDLVDEHNGNPPYIRIIDYKTGSDETKVSDFATAMDNSKTKNCKALIQIFLYCNFYNYIRKSDEKIKPLIYTVRNMAEAEIRINRIVVNDYHDFNDDFIQEMGAKIEEMFDENIPFTQTCNDNTCQYCKYKDFCRK